MRLPHELRSTPRWFNCAYSNQSWGAGTVDGRCENLSVPGSAATLGHVPAGNDNAQPFPAD